MTCQIRMLVGLLLAACVVVGCQSPHQDPRLAHLTSPSDFALELFVQPTGVGQTSAARYVVQPDRRLRGWQGDQVTAHHLPPAIGRLATDEMDAMLELIDRYELLAEPTSPGARQLLAGESSSQVDDAAAGSAATLDDSPTPSAVVHVAITARGRTVRFATTGQESPPVARLLNMLEKLAEQHTPGLLPVTDQARTDAKDANHER